MKIPSTTVKNNFGQYLRLCVGEPVYITKNGKVIAKLEHYEDEEDDDFMVAEALEAATLLKQENIHATVIDSVTIKPIDERTIIEYAKKTGAMVSAENANVIGGLGDAVASVLACHYPVPLEKVGIQDKFGEVGTESYLRERFNLTTNEIVANVKKVIQRKA